MQNDQAIKAIAGTDGAVVIVTTDSDARPSQQSDSCVCCRASCPGASMRTMRIIQIAFAIIHVIAVCVLLVAAASEPRLCYDWSPYSCKYLLRNFWAFFVPVATIGVTIAQLFTNNPVDPGCRGRAAHCHRYAGDLVFAILYTFQMAGLLILSFLFTPFWNDTIPLFLSGVFTSDCACLALMVTYWVTYGNVRGCCIGQVNNF